MRILIGTIIGIFVSLIYYKIMNSEKNVKRNINKFLEEAKNKFPDIEFKYEHYEDLFFIYYATNHFKYRPEFSSVITKLYGKYFASKLISSITILPI